MDPALPEYPDQPAAGRVPVVSPRLHRAWLVAGVTALALIATAAFRSTTGAFFQPLEHEFGWHRSGLSTAVMINLVIYGLAAPFAATMLERFSMRKVAIGAGLAVVTAGHLLRPARGLAADFAHPNGARSGSSVFYSPASRAFAVARGIPDGRHVFGSGRTQQAFGNPGAPS